MLNEAKRRNAASSAVDGGKRERSGEGTAAEPAKRTSQEVGNRKHPGNGNPRPSDREDARSKTPASPRSPKLEFDQIWLRPPAELTNQQINDGVVC
jgi:hypothetical protein